MERMENIKKPRDIYNGMSPEEYDKSILKMARLRSLESSVVYAIREGRFADVQGLLDQYKVDPSVFF